MAFTLTDPRMQAISQAAGNFGTGMGNALNQYVNNKIFANALKQSQGQNPIEMMQTLANANVDPASRELAMSPQILQRMQGINLANMIQDAYDKMQRGEGTINDVVQAALKGMAQTGDLSKAGDLVNMLTGEIFSNKIIEDAGAPIKETPRQMPSEGPDGVRPPRGNAQESKPPYKLGETPFVKGRVINKRAGETPEEIIPSMPAVRPYTPEEQDALRADIYQKFRGFPIQRREDEFQRRLAQRDKEVAAAEKELAFQRSAREKEIEFNENMKNYADTRLDADYRGNDYVNSDMRTLVQDKMLQEKGTQAQRYAKVKANFIDPIIKEMNGLNKKLNVPQLETLESPKKQAVLKAIHPSIKRVIDRFPKDENSQRIAHEMVRTQLRKKPGLGVISAEYALFPPKPETVAFVKNLPNGYSDQQIAMSADPQRLIDSNQKAIKKLVPWIKDSIERGESPIVLKDFIVYGKNYSNDVFNEALSEVIDSGIEIPPELEQALQDSKLAYKPNLWQQAQGTGVYNLGEFSR